MPIHSIVTYHAKSKAEDVAEVWILEGVCATGYCMSCDGIDTERINSKEKLKEHAKYETTNDINELWNFLQIKKGDIILAYCQNSIIAAVGEVIGDYTYNTENKIGQYNGFCYPHQKKVKWFKHPRFFDKKKLPAEINNKVGLRGKGITSIYFPKNSFKLFLNEIPSTYLRKFNEDTVKAGLSKFLRQDLDNLEDGLHITNIEKSINSENRPDFLAIDKNGKKVIIECKGVADKEAIEQLKRYRANYPETSRCLLIASKVSDETIMRLSEKSRTYVKLIHCVH